MIYNFEISATLLKVKENVINNGRYFNISVDNNDSVGTMPCTEEVYQHITSNKLPLYKQYIFACSFNDSYPNAKVRVVGIKQ